MTAEVRGRGRKWKVFYPDESGLVTTHLVYGKDGTVVRSIEAGAPTGALVESRHEPFTTCDEAVTYARYLGATEVRIVRTSSRAESLAKGRKAKRKDTNA